jgi:hypothetical protein
VRKAFEKKSKEGIFGYPLATFFTKDPEPEPILPFMKWLSAKHDVKVKAEEIFTATAGSVQTFSIFFKILAKKVYPLFLLNYRKKSFFLFLGRSYYVQYSLLLYDNKIIK